MRATSTGIPYSSSDDRRIEEKVFNLGREVLVIARREAGTPEQILLNLVQAAKEPWEMEVRPKAEEIRNLLNSSIRILQIPASHLQYSASPWMAGRALVGLRA